MRYFLYQDEQRLWRWMLFDVDDAVIAKSDRGYSDKQKCLRDIDLVKRSQKAPIRDHPPILSVSF